MVWFSTSSVDCRSYWPWRSPIEGTTARDFETTISIELDGNDRECSASSQYSFCLVLSVMRTSGICVRLFPARSVNSAIDILVLLILRIVRYSATCGNLRSRFHEGRTKYFTRSAVCPIQSKVTMVLIPRLSCHKQRVPSTTIICLKWRWLTLTILYWEQ